MGVVLWIAIFVRHLEDLFAYVDDTFLWEFADNMTWYEPYGKYLPTKQARLLKLWDDICLPHEESKQLFGSRLTIIGLNVDPNAMTIMMPEQSCSDLVVAIRCFTHPVPGNVNAVSQDGG